MGAVALAPRDPFCIENMLSLFVLSMKKHFRQPKWVIVTYLQQTNMIWIISNSWVSILWPTIPVFMDALLLVLWVDGLTVFGVFWVVGYRKKGEQCTWDHRERENIHCMRCCFCSGNLVKLDLLPHASVDKEVCFLSGQYICSCQQVGQQIAFHLTLIQLNIFGLSIQPPVIGYQCLSSAPVWSPHFMSGSWLVFHCNIIGFINTSRINC